MPLAIGDNGCSKHRVGENKKKGSLHTADLRHFASRRVVNNSAFFLLAISSVTVINGLSVTRCGPDQMITTAAFLFGIGLLVLGILGFVPAATPSSGMLFGIFHVNTAHNIVHLASGIVFLLCGVAGGGPSRAFFKIFGIIYALVVVLGFYYGGNALLGIISNNTADIWLHVGLAVVMLFLGFGTSGSKAAV